jgi:hypothetical protein
VVEMNTARTYTLDKLSEEYKQANLKPKTKEEEYFLLNASHPIWRVLFPHGMIVVGFIIGLLGGIE